MKTIKANIELFDYDELSKESRDVAFNEHLEFLSSLGYESEDEDGNMITEDIMEWEQKELIDYVEESIRINDYYFFESGEMAHTVHYTGKHEKAGITELMLLGDVYELL